MKLFSVNTAIYSCRCLEELASEFAVGSGDVILTSRHTLSGTAPAAMMLPAPMVTPPHTVAPAHSQQ